MNILITSASRKVSLVRAFQSALARCGGGSVIAVDVSPYAPALYVADRHFLVSPSAESHFIEELVKLCEDQEVALIIPTRDEELPLFAKIRERLEQSGVRVMVPAFDTVRTCQDKHAFIAFCRAHQFGIPHTYEGNQWQTAPFPLFVKPRLGKAAKGARRVLNKAELGTILDDPKQWIVQECVNSPEYTIDLLADFNNRVLSVVPRLRQLVVAGESYVSRTVHEPFLMAEATRLATELHLVGHNTIQCFWDGKEAKFVEVNPRFGGAAALGIAAGADSPAMLVRLVKGENLAEQLGQFQPDLVMLRFTDDLYLDSRALAPRARDHRVIGEKPLRGTVRAGLQAVLFDLDNTLYPEEEFVTSGFRAVAGCLAKRQHVDADKIAERLLHILHAHGRGRVFNILLDELKLDSSTWLPTLLLVYRSHQPAISLLPETGALLRALKRRDMRLGLVTDGAAATQRRKIAALGLERQMDAIVCTDELGEGCAKPSTVPFEVALTLLEVPPEKAVYIADDTSKDFAGPNRLGMKSIRVPGPGLVGAQRTALPDDPVYRPLIEAGSLGETLRILEQL